MNYKISITKTGKLKNFAKRNKKLWPFSKKKAKLRIIKGYLVVGKLFLIKRITKTYMDVFIPNDQKLFIL